MIRGDVAAGGYEHGRRLWCEAQPGAYCGRFSGSRRMDRRGDPAPARVGADSAGADEHEVRNGAQQRHHEAIRLVEAADLSPTAARFRVERHDAVESRDEVCDHGRTSVDEM